MNQELKKQMEQEIKERNRGSYSKLIEANEVLVDKLKWIKEDIEREIFKLNNTSVDDVFSKKEIIDFYKRLVYN